MKKLLSLALVLAMVFTSFTFVYAADLIDGLTGSGTETDPVLIGSVADWNTFAAANAAGSTFSGNFIKLTADLDFGGAAPTRAGDFAGTLDGNNHVIKNYTVEIPESMSGSWNKYAGLIVQLKAGTIKNLGAEDVTFDTTYYNVSNNNSNIMVGALAGYANGAANIKNCYVNGIKIKGTTTNYSLGGLVGYAHWWFQAGVENCYVISKVGQEGYIATTQAPSRGFYAIVGKINPGTSYVYVDNCYTDIDTLIESGVSGWNNNEAYAGAARVTNSYYNSATIFGKVSQGIGKTEAELKSANMVTLLGAGFKADDKFANDGYPLLAWQEVGAALSKNANLATLTVSAGELSPAFAASKTEYELYVLNEVDKITINATAADANATVSGTVTDKALTVGDNPVAITVTAQDTTVTKTYNIVVKRLKAGEDIPQLLPEGAPEDAILITSLDDLKAISGTATEGKYYVLTTDIDMKDEYWTSFIGTASNPFKGTFHGNSHAIRNFKIQNTGASDVGYGIFGYVDGNALITHLGVENVQHLYTGSSGIYYSHSSFGGIVAFLQGNSKVENCFAKNVLIDTKIPNSSAWSGFYGDQVSYAGGVVGVTVGGNVEVTNCYSINFQEIDDSASSQGGVVGSAPASSFKAITNCYSNFMLTSCDAADKGKVINCYTTDTSGWSANGAKPGILVTDAELKNKATDLGEGYIADIQGLNNGYPMLAWEMSLTRLEGNGSAENPFLIVDVDTLAQVAGHRDTAGKYYKLTDDIDFAGATLATFIGKVGAPFEGTFDGNGKVIKNFVIAPPESGLWSELGIFACVGGNAVIKNVGIENVTVSPDGEWSFNATVGGLVAIMEGNAKVTDCYVKNMKFKNDNDAIYNAQNGGGLVGLIVSDGVVVENCYALNVTKEKHSVAMFNAIIGVAKEFSAIRNCYTDGSVAMTYRKNVGKISNSYRLTDENGAGYSRLGILTKEAVLKTKATDLGASFTTDSTLINGGYPVLTWEVQ